MADAMKEKGLHRFEENTPNIWYHLAMGSDFDGGIDPVNTYKTVSQYPNLRADLKKEFRGEGRNWNLADYNIRPENADRILDLIFFENAKRLVVKHLKNAPVMT
jgi:microsomal dipeptidase-like Zn-dependent dipeptidase